METRSILAELRAERDRVDKAIAALEALEGASAPATTARRGRPPKSASAPTVAQPKPARDGRRVISQEGRKRIAEAARRRWAKQKKAAAKKA